MGSSSVVQASFSHEAPEVHHVAPEPVQISGGIEVPYGEAPQVCYEAPEPYRFASYAGAKQHRSAEIPRPTRKLLGFSPRIFWVSFSLSLLLVGAAISGGVGGTVVQRQHSR